MAIEEEIEFPINVFLPKIKRKKPLINREPSNKIPDTLNSGTQSMPESAKNVIMDSIGTSLEIETAAKTGGCFCTN